MSPAPQLPERERNRLLRRADWRFLLSCPRPGRVLCLAGGELRSATDLVAAHVDGREALRGGEVYDLVVASDPGARELAVASEHVASGGELYTEWRAGMAARDAVQRQLTANGFDDTTFYWPWPEPPWAEVWVPLHLPETFDYYLSIDRHVYSGVRHRLGLRGRQLLGRARLHAGRATPLCAVSRTAAARSSSLDTPPHLIETAWRQAEPGAPPRRLTCTLLTGGPRAISKVVGAVFTDAGAPPTFVVKWPRVKESEPGLVREANALAACHASRSADGVPRLLARTDAGAMVAIVETVAAGAPLYTRLHRRNYAALARKAAQWLTGFVEAHRGGPLPPSAWTHRTANAIDRFVDTFGRVIDPGLVRETTALVAAIEPVPPVIEHRDFGPWNIVVDDAGRLGVLDWESSELRGLPMLDLMYFVTYLAFFLDGAMASRRFVESYRATLDARSFTGAVRHELLEAQRATLGIAPATERALRALCWIGHAESEFQHYTADAGGTPAPDALRRSVFVQLWTEEIRDLCRC